MARLLAADTIQVVFSENISLPACSFEVYVGGIKDNSASSLQVTNGNTVSIKFSAITSLNKTIQVKLVNGLTTDMNGNFAETGKLVNVAY
jgi:hypothetical protein